MAPLFWYTSLTKYAFAISNCFPVLDVTNVTTGKGPQNRPSSGQFYENVDYSAVSKGKELKVGRKVDLFILHSLIIDITVNLLFLEHNPWLTYFSHGV